MISIIQIIFLLIGVLFLTSVFIQVQRDRMTKGQAIMWGLIWLCLILSTFFVQYLTIISEWLGITRPIDIIIYSSIILLFVYTYQIQLAQVKLSRELTELVRKDAINKNKTLSKRTK